MKVLKFLQLPSTCGVLTGWGDDNTAEQVTFCSGTPPNSTLPLSSVAGTSVVLLIVTLLVCQDVGRKRAWGPWQVLKNAEMPQTLTCKVGATLSLSSCPHKGRSDRHERMQQALDLGQNSL